MYRIPILLLIFNRPGTTEKVFQAIKRLRPKELYVAADGPRVGQDADIVNCAAARSIVDRVDWPCDVKTLFRASNLGCRRAVSSAIDWFFEHVEQGVILEDDCLPDEDFFKYCENMLRRYKDDRRLMMITGTNFCDSATPSGVSYFFSRHFSVWGWATWRRAWMGYDVDLQAWGGKASYTKLVRATGTRRSGIYNALMLDRVKDGILDTWDYQWTFHCLMNGGLAATPGKNLVTNIGVEGTHGSGRRGFHHQQIEGLEGELVEPEAMQPEIAYEECIAREIDRITWMAVGIFWFERLLRRTGPLERVHRFLLSSYRRLRRS